MRLPPAVIVHGLPHAMAAQAPGLPVSLLSAPGAALYGGCFWWQNLLNQAAFCGPALLDCGAAPGRAAEALTRGINFLILAPCPTWAELAAKAAESQGHLFPAPPPALDMANLDAMQRLERWLAG